MLLGVVGGWKRWCTIISFSVGKPASLLFVEGLANGWQGKEERLKLLHSTEGNKN